MSKKGNNVNETPATRLQDCMKAKKMSVGTLSIMAKCSRQHIYNILNGNRDLKYEYAVTFSRILGVRKEYLMCEDGCKTDDEYERERDLYWKNKNRLEEVHDLVIDMHSKAFIDFINTTAYYSISESDGIYELIQGQAGYTIMMNNNPLAMTIEEDNEPEYFDISDIDEVKEFPEEPEVKSIYLSRQMFNSLIESIEGLIESHFEMMRNAIQINDFRNSR